MISQELENKYKNCIDIIEMYENRTSIKFSQLVIKEECRNKGIGTALFKDLINYADLNKKIITLTPSDDFGGDKNRLAQYYKRFGFKYNQSIYSHSEMTDTMIRYPKLNETIKPVMKKLIKNLLREGLMSKEELVIKQVTDFVNFAKNFLGINDDVKIELSFVKTPDIKTTAYYDNNKHLVKVYVKDRAIIDVCRSISHELVHHKQNIEGLLTNNQTDGADGSPIENEANAVAGIIIRKYGKLYPEIYS